MIYISLSKLPKILVIAKRCCIAPLTLALIGAYFPPLSSSNLAAQAQSAIPDTSVPQNTESQGGRPRGGTLQPGGTHAQDVEGQGGRPEGNTRQPGGTRGACPRVNKPLTALVPMTKETSSASQNSNAAKATSNSSLGLTVAERPTFWFYVPYSFNPSRRIEFVLQDEEGNDIYQTSSTESGILPGVVGFQLPSTAPALQVNRVYRWFFLVYCKPEEPIHVEGTVKRVALNSSLARQLEQAKPEEKFALYAKAGISQEALTSLAALRRQNPEDATLKDEWIQLLKSMNLDAIAQEPITTMLTPKK